MFRTGLKAAAFLCAAFTSADASMSGEYLAIERPAEATEADKTGMHFLSLTFADGSLTARFVRPRTAAPLFPECREWRGCDDAPAMLNATYKLDGGTLRITDWSFDDTNVFMHPDHDKAQYVDPLVAFLDGAEVREDGARTILSNNGAQVTLVAGTAGMAKQAAYWLARLPVDPRLIGDCVLGQIMAAHRSGDGELLRQAEIQEDRIASADATHAIASDDPAREQANLRNSMLRAIFQPDFGETDAPDDIKADLADLYDNDPAVIAILDELLPKYASDLAVSRAVTGRYQALGTQQQAVADRVCQDMLLR